MAQTDQLDASAISVALNALKAEMVRGKISGAVSEEKCLRAGILAYLQITSVATAATDSFERLRATVMTLTPDESATADEHKIGLRVGHRQACAQVYDLISATLGDDI